MHLGWHLRHSSTALAPLGRKRRRSRRCTAAASEEHKSPRAAAPRGTGGSGMQAHSRPRAAPPSARRLRHLHCSRAGAVFLWTCGKSEKRRAVRRHGKTAEDVGGAEVRQGAECRPALPAVMGEKSIFFLAAARGMLRAHRRKAQLRRQKLQLCVFDRTVQRGEGVTEPCDAFVRRDADTAIQRAGRIQYSLHLGAGFSGQNAACPGKESTGRFRRNSGAPP